VVARRPLLRLFSFFTSLARQEQCDDEALRARQAADTAVLATAVVMVLAVVVAAMVVPTGSQPLLVVVGLVFFGHQWSHIICVMSLSFFLSRCVTK